MNLNDLDWAELWRELQREKGASDNSSYWDKRAPKYAKIAGHSSYSKEFLSRAGLQPGDTVLDMGCGSGTLTIPLAQQGHHVYAADFSQGMLDQLVERTDELGLTEYVHPMHLAWSDDWDAADVPRCDIAFASRSIATDDLQDSLQKLDAHARQRVCISLTTGLSPKVDGFLLNVMGREQPKYPDFVFGLLILWQMGIRADLSFIDSTRTSNFQSFDEAIDKNCDCIEATKEERDRLIAYSKEHLHEVVDEDGASHWEYDHTRVTSWAFLAWDKSH